MFGLPAFMNRKKITRIYTITDYYAIYLEQRKRGNKRKLTVDRKEVFIKKILLDDTHKKLTCNVCFSNGTELLITEERNGSI